MKPGNITFIGSGNMARSLIGGLIADGCDPQQLWAADPNASQLEQLKTLAAIHTSTDNHAAVEHADVVVLAVKPQAMKQAATELSDVIQTRKPLVISIAAGIRTTDLQQWLGEGIALVRTMPNTPALVQTGATALYANEFVNEVQKEQAESIMRAVGLALWVESESLLDTVTALSGSGPAYFFLVMEAMEQAATRLGLPEQTARLLTLQTALGAAKMALESSEDPAILRQRVTSPGGTTEQAIKTLQEGQLEQLFDQALNAAHQRSKELSKIFGDPE